MRPQSRIRIKFSLFLLLICTAFSNYTSAQQIAPEVIDSIHSILHKFPVNTQFSIGIVDKDSTTFMGYKRMEGGISFIQNEDSLFEIGSITKVFTTTIFGLKVLNSEVGLEDKLSKYLDLPIESEVTSITLRELANHTSGLPRIPPNLSIWENYQNPYKAYSFDDLLEFLKSSHPVLDSLNKEYAYSNVGMGLLAQILVLQDSSTFEKTLDKYIFYKNSMNSTTSQRLNIKNNDLVKGLNVDGTIANGWDFDALAGAGAIISSTTDMAKFIKYQLSMDSSLDSIVMSPTYRFNDYMDIGLGWHILHRSGKDYHWHNGGTGGYTSSLLLDRKQSKGIIILTNISAFHPDSKVVDELALYLIR